MARPDTSTAPSVVPGPAHTTSPASRDGSADGDAHAFWEDHTRIVLTPYSPPSIIGLYGFMGATLMVGAWQAGW